MSSKQDISKPHKCFAAKCKGRMVDPIDSYGKWAYWWGDVADPKDSGWHNKPQNK